MIPELVCLTQKSSALSDQLQSIENQHSAENVIVHSLQYTSVITDEQTAVYKTNLYNLIYLVACTIPWGRYLVDSAM